MEFGTLVPQGWRYDLMGVDGAAAKWETFKKVSRALDSAGWDSLWVWDHFHTFPKKQVEATFEAWTLMATLAEITQARAHRSDRHLRAVPRAGLPREDLRVRRRGVGRPAQRGPRLGLVRGRVQSLRLRLSHDRHAASRASRRRFRFSISFGPSRSRASRANTIGSSKRSASRSRCRSARPCGSADEARKSCSGSSRSTPTCGTTTARSTSSTTPSRC